MQNSQENKTTIKPISDNSGYFASQILKDLVSQGYEGNQLIAKFKETQSKIRPAIEKLLSEADKVVVGNTNSVSFEDVFSLRDWQV